MREGRLTRAMGETNYRVVWQADQTYSVEITAPDGSGPTVPSFKREADARKWIAEQTWKAALAGIRSQTAPPGESDR
jgi:hypothetical protein